MKFKVANSFKKWEVSIAKFEVSGIIKYKVTRRMSSMYVAETKFFNNKEAVKLFEEWLS